MMIWGLPEMEGMRKDLLCLVYCLLDNLSARDALFSIEKTTELTLLYPSVNHSRVCEALFQFAYVVAPNLFELLPTHGKSG